MIAPNSLSTSVEISVIVPARNEEACLGSCLESLAGQKGIKFEIIVVDDGSTDRTAEIARSFAGVRAIEAPNLPAGWSGKTNAMFAGASVAQGEWLLFTDADTVHRPGSLAGSVAEAKRRHSDLLSYSPEQEVHGLAEKAVMAVIFAELAATYRPARVSDPRYSAAAANGQYLLIRRAVYNAVGGHSAVAGTLLEDVALARAVKQSGHNIFFRYGADMVRTRMYRSFRELREGWTKNLALLFPSPGRLAVQRLTEFILITGSAVSAIVLAARGDRGRGIFAASVCVALWGLLLRRIRRAHFAWEANLLSIGGLPLFSYLLLRSILAHKKGTVSWKGRRYGSPVSPASALQSIPAETKPGWQAPA